MCGQHKIMDGRRWVCIRDEHPDEPDNHHYVSSERARRHVNNQIFKHFWVD